jgi:hypothetical protein
MPAVKSFKDSKGKSRTYNLYTTKEIKNAWFRFGRSHETGIDNGNPYCMLDAKDEDEALVLAALTMREADIPPACTYYSKNREMLYVNGNYNKMEFGVIKACCAYIARIYLGIPNLRVISRDLDGQPLFRKAGSDCDDFYKNRNFPKGNQPKKVDQPRPFHGASQVRIDPLPLSPINVHVHESLIPPDYRGLM